MVFSPKPGILPGLTSRIIRRFDYDAFMVTDSAFYRNPHYHEPTDMIDTTHDTTIH